MRLIFLAGLLAVLIPAALFAVTPDEVSRRLRAADPNGQVLILEALPGQMVSMGKTERSAFAPLLLSIVRDPARERLHAAAQRPLVMTGIRISTEGARASEPQALVEAESTRRPRSR